MRVIAKEELKSLAEKVVRVHELTEKGLPGGDRRNAPE